MKVIRPKNSQLTIKIILYSIILILVSIILFGGYSYLDLELLIKKQVQSEITKENAVKSAGAIKEIRRKQPVYIDLPGAKQIRAIVEDYSLTESIWHVVSKTSPISVDYVPTSIKIPDVATRTDKSNDERSLRTDIEKPMVDMFAAALVDGYHLLIGSGYRSANLQSIYYNSLSNAIGAAAANLSIALPGQSEHQTGLAADISTLSRECYIDTCFATTGDGVWLANNSYRFGFILRYPSGKESITGYNYEPWHFRYVGVDLATALYESGLTLDEALPYLQTANDTLRHNGAI